MIKKTNTQFQFQSTNRTFDISMDGISLTQSGEVRYGYDGYVNINDAEGLPDAEIEFTKEEKKELAAYIINQWNNWANL